MSLVKLANEFEEEQQAPSKLRNTGIGTGIGAGLGAALGGTAGYLGRDFLANAHEFADSGFDELYADGYRFPSRRAFTAGSAAAGAAGLGLLGAGIGGATDIVRNIKQTPREKVANELEEEQQPSKWRNTGIGAGVGAGLGALTGIPGGLPYMVGNSVRLGLLGAGIGGVTDVVRNINQAPREKVANELEEEQQYPSKWHNTKIGAGVGAGLGAAAGGGIAFLGHKRLTKTNPSAAPSRRALTALNAGTSAVGLGVLGAASGAGTDIGRNIREKKQREKVANDNSQLLLIQQQQMYTKLLEEQQKRQELANLPTNYTTGLGTGFGTAFMLNGFNNRNPNQLKSLGIGAGAGLLAHTLANTQGAKERRYNNSRG